MCACRLALEAVLSGYADAGDVKRLATEIHCHAEGWAVDGGGGGGGVERLLSLLAIEELKDCVLNVCSVLLFTQRLAEQALLAWRDEWLRRGGDNDTLFANKLLHYYSGSRIAAMCSC